MKLPLKSQDGMTLLTKKKYCGENIDIIPELQVKEVSFLPEAQSITPDSGYAGLKEVKVSAIPDFDKYARVDVENDFTAPQTFVSAAVLNDPVNEYDVSRKIDLDKKRDRITPDGTYTRVYSQNKDGTESSIIAATSIQGKIPLRNDNGNIIGNTAKGDTEYTTLGQVNAIAKKVTDETDTKLQKKRDIVQPAEKGKAARIYSVVPISDKYPEGAQGFMEAGTSNFTQYSVPQRAANGQLNLPNQLTYVPSNNQAVSKGYGDNNYLGKSGGTVNGNLTITGDLTVSGTTTTEKEEQLLVKANVIATNADKADLQTLLSGLAINKNKDATYGIMYDPVDDTVKFGEGTLSADNKFVFKDGEGHPLAIRADSTKFTDAHLVKWDETTNSFVDAGFALEGGEAELSIQQPPARESFINTIVGYVKNSTEENPAGKNAYGAYVDPSIYNADDNTTKVENNGERTTMLGGLSASIPATPTEVRPSWSGYGSQSLIHGKRIINTGDQNHIFGTDHIVYGNNNFIAGLRNVATNGEVTMLGTGLIGTRLWQVILGRYNKPSHSFFQIGGGKQVQHIDGTNPDGSNRYVLDSIERKNVIEIDEGGNAILAGRLNIGIEPAGESDAVRLKELNEGLATKANLVPIPATGSVLYGVPSASKDGQPQAYTTGTEVIAQYAIPQRTAGGQINMPDQTKAIPTDDQAITKIFGDTNYLKLEGGEISGGLSVIGDPIIDTDVVRLKDLNAVKTTIGAIGDTNPPTLEKVIYCQESEIPATPETGVEYACTDYIAKEDLDADLQAEIDGKQDKLTFDTTPSASSTNPVTSAGIYNAISNFLTIQVSDSLIGG